MMRTARDHTFVVCAYGENPFLEETVESIERQSVRGDVIVATSTPNAHIAGVCERHGLSLVSHEGQSTIARDWNYGFDHAETDLVTIAHQDDRYEPAYLERVLDAFNRPGVHPGVVHTGYYELRDGRRVEDNRLLRVKRLMNRVFARAMETGSPAAKRRALAFGDFVCCPSVTLDRSVVGASVFDTAYVNSCDYRTWIQLASRGVAFRYVPHPLMGHRIYAGSTTTANIANDVRSAEDRELLASLWPKPIANLLFKVYASGQKSNEL